MPEGVHTAFRSLLEVARPALAGRDHVGGAKSALSVARVEDAAVVGPPLLVVPCSTTTHLPGASPIDAAPAKRTLDSAPRTALSTRSDVVFTVS